VSIDPAHRTRRRPGRAAGAVLALALAVLTACGDDSPDDSGDAGAGATTSAATSESSPAPAPTTAGPSEPAAETESVTVTAEDFAFSVDEDGFAAGSYEITLVNGGGSTHDLVVERDGEDVAGTDAIDPGQEATLTVDLEPGEYVFYCSIANHRAMGMEITVTVT
jgi:plastocyanin